MASPVFYHSFQLLSEHILAAEQTYLVAQHQTHVDELHGGGSDKGELKGQQVSSPADATQLRFGPANQREQEPVAICAGSTRTALSVTAEESVHCHAGIYCLHGDTRQDAGCFRISPSAAARPEAGTRFWRIGVASPAVAHSNSVGASDYASRRGETLRVELPDLGNDLASRLVIGTRSEDGHFVSILTISSNGDMSVDGDLITGGKVTQGPRKPDPDDPRFVAELVKAWRDGTESVNQRDHEVMDMDLDQIRLAKDGRLIRGSLYLQNSGATRLNNLSVMLTVYGSGIIEQNRLLGETDQDPATSLRAGQRRPVDVSIELPESTGATSAPLQIVANAAAINADGTPVHRTAVAVLSIPNKSREGEP